METTECEVACDDGNIALVESSEEEPVVLQMASQYESESNNKVKFCKGYKVQFEGKSRFTEDTHSTVILVKTLPFN